MKIFTGQIYIQVGVTFPFSIPFQMWLGAALSERVDASEQFSRAYGADYTLGIRISAKAELDEPEIKGPTRFKRDKTVEFSIFLPHGARDYHDLSEASLIVERLLNSIVLVLNQLGLDSTNVVRDIPQLVAEFQTTPGLMKPR